MVTSDAYLYERACRFHDVTVRRDYPSKLRFMPGLNYRMNEFMGGVLLAQLRKLDTIIGDARRNARRVYRGISDLPATHVLRLPDPDGELGTGIFLGFRTKEERERYAQAMKAEGVPAAWRSLRSLAPFTRPTWKTRNRPPRCGGAHGECFRRWTPGIQSSTLRTRCRRSVSAKT